MLVAVLVASLGAGSRAVELGKYTRTIRRRLEGGETASQIPMCRPSLRGSIPVSFRGQSLRSHSMTHRIV